MQSTSSRDSVKQEYEDLQVRALGLFCLILGLFCLILDLFQAGL